MASVVRRNRSLPSNASKDASRRRQANDDGGDARPQKRSRPSGANTASGNGRTGPLDQRTTTASSSSTTAALLRGPNPQVARNGLGGQGARTAAPALASDVTPSLLPNRSKPTTTTTTTRRRSGQVKMSRTTKARRSTDKSSTGAKSTTAPQRRRRQQQQQQQQRQQGSSSPDEHPVSRSRRRVDDGDEENEDEDEDEDQEEDEDDDEEDEEDSAESDVEEEEGEHYPVSPGKPYAHVAPFTRRVRQSTIQSEWTPLGRGSIKALTSMLQLTQRPILQRLGASQARRAATEAGLGLITRRILEKVAGNNASSSNNAGTSSRSQRLRPGLPFPPASLPTRTRRGRPRGGRAEQDGGRETELNFESVLDAKQTLERQLDPVLHAVDLLGVEARRLEEELERDYETLRLLEAQGRAKARENRSLLRKAHELAPEATTGRDGGGGGLEEEADVRFLRTDGDVEVNPFQDIEDARVKALVVQLGANIDAIRDNMALTGGVGDEIARTRAALQAVLAKKLSPARYERVILGEAGVRE